MNDKDTIYRQAAIDELDFSAELLRRTLDDTDVVGAERTKFEWGLGLIESCISDLKDLPSVEPDNRLAKIADLVEGTIDHFDLDDAMDLLYQIKEVLKNG